MFIGLARRRAAAEQRTTTTAGARRRGREEGRSGRRAPVGHREAWQGHRGDGEGPSRAVTVKANNGRRQRKGKSSPGLKPVGEIQENNDKKDAPGHHTHM